MMQATLAKTERATGGILGSTICGMAHIFFYQIILDLETPLESTLRSLLKTHLQDPLEVILRFHQKTS